MLNVAGREGNILRGIPCRQMFKWSTFLWPLSHLTKESQAWCQSFHKPCIQILLLQRSQQLLNLLWLLTFTTLVEGEGFGLIISFLFRPTPGVPVASFADKDEQAGMSVPWPLWAQLQGEPVAQNSHPQEMWGSFRPRWPSETGVQALSGSKLGSRLLMSMGREGWCSPRHGTPQPTGGLRTLPCHSEKALLHRVGAGALNQPGESAGDDKQRHSSSHSPAPTPC